jgi:hypothetical protein
MAIDRKDGDLYPSHEWEVGCGYSACAVPAEENVSDDELLAQRPHPEKKECT